MFDPDILDRPAFMEITWNDPKSTARGYVVIDRLVRGVSSGGLRMRAGCTLDEVRGLASAMTKKEAIHLRPGMRYTPVGGAKGGIDFDPQHPEAPAVLERFLVDLQPLIQTRWAMGEDFGVRQDVIDEIFARRGLGTSVDAVGPLIADPESAAQRRRTGFSTSAYGVPQDELVGGLGVAEAALTALERRGERPQDTRAVVQGFGSMGGATALFLAKAGVRIVGIVDADGMVRDERGLDVLALIGARDRFGRMDRSRLPEGAVAVDGADWLASDCELLVPAALSGCVTTQNQGQIRARLIVEAANLPVTAEAEAALAKRGVVVVPDFIANSGTNAWWWWLVFGDIDGSWAQSEQIVRSRLAELTGTVLDRAAESERTPRDTALDIARENLAELLAFEGSR